MKPYPFLYSLFAAFLVAPAIVGASGRSNPASIWDLNALGRTPATYPAEGFAAKDLRALFYEGPSYKGNPTRVFAFYGAPTVRPGRKLPAVVLVHGGGGTAYERWVRLWVSRGYAAIAMDLCGSVPIGRTAKWQRHAEGGPPGWGGFDQLDWEFADQWTGQAVSDVILAHSLIRSFPEVDPDRIGVIGISWGGYLTCIVAGLDQRFKFAVPVYGCGFLGDNSVWTDRFATMGPELSGRWLGQWDPSHYLGRAGLPMLWVTGTNDFAYPMDSLQKSYRLAPGKHALVLRVRMPHGHGAAGEDPEEMRAFADSVLRAGVPLAKIVKQGRDGGRVWASYWAEIPMVKAELNYTKDTGKWQERRWETVPASLDPGKRLATATLPEGATVYYLNFIDDRGLIVSSEHGERP